MLGLAAAAAGFALTRGGDDDATEERREAVAAYIARVNTVQQAAILELERVSATYRQLRLSGRPDPVQRRRVEAAETSLRELRARLSALSPPPEAARLRRELLQLVDLQVVLAEEVAGMVRYLPVEAAQNRRLAAATERLRDALERADTGAAQRDAFTAFRRVLLDAAAALDEAAAPDVLEPSRTGEVARLRKLASLAQRLAAALAEAEAEDVDRLFPQFVQTSASTGTTKAERDAVIAFNRRLKQITEQRTAIVEERSRLDLALR